MEVIFVPIRAWSRDKEESRHLKLERYVWRTIPTNKHVNLTKNHFSVHSFSHVLLQSKK